MLVQKISSVAVIGSKSLQGHSTHVSQQLESLENIHAILIDMFSVQLDRDSELDALGAHENSTLCTDSLLCLNVDDIRGLLGHLGTFVAECVETLTDEENRSLLLALGQSVLKLISSIGTISAEMDSKNESASALPAVLTHNIVKLLGLDFRAIFRTHRDRLLTRWSNSKIDLIEQQFEDPITSHGSDVGIQEVSREI